MNPDEMDNVTDEMDDVIVEEPAPEPEPEPEPAPPENGEITASISADVESIPEGNDGETTTVTYTVSTSAPLDRDARVIVESIGGNNPLVSEPLDISAGQQSVTFTNEVSGDSIPEENETLTGTLAFAAFNAPDGSTGDEIAISQPTVNVTVIDDDGGDTLSEISIEDAAIVEGNEGNTALEFTVSLSQPIEEETTVDFNTFDDSAVAGEDYVSTSGSLSFAPGETTQTISVDLIGDTVDEGDETFFVGLSNAFPVAIANLEATGTIIDDDGDSEETSNITADLSVDVTSLPEGNDGETSVITYTVTLSEPVPDQSVRGIIDITSSDPNNSLDGFVFDDGADEGLDIAPGETTGTFTYTFSGDSIEEPDETIDVSLGFVGLMDDGSGNGRNETFNFGQSFVSTTIIDDDGDTGGGGTDEGGTGGGGTDGGDTGGDDTGGGGTDEGSNIVYRFFNPTAGVHFYTDDEVERDFVQDQLDNYEFEGSSYRTVDSLSGQAEDVYRFFNSNTGVHLYTTDENERDSIIENLDDFTFEGSAYSAYETEIEGSIPIYRFYEPTIGVHFYTPSEAERDVVDTELDNYNNEGIAFYALPLEAGDL